MDLHKRSQHSRMFVNGHGFLAPPNWQNGSIFNELCLIRVEAGAE